MGATTSIEWAANADGSPGATWNPIAGCSMAPGSEKGGCLNCYAARMSARNLPGMRSPSTGQPFAVLRDSGPRWTGVLELIPERLGIPLRRRKPTTYFVNSMSDLFHESLPDEAIDQVFAVMTMCAQHRFIVLTKRAKRMAGYFAAKRGHFSCEYQSVPAKSVSRILPLENVILGVSCEDQPTADERIPHLLRTPAVCRMVSLEPMLGPIDPERGRGFLSGHSHDNAPYLGKRLDWVIAGGESGPGARPMDEAWVRTIKDQCVDAGVSFFYKQRLDGGRKTSLPELDGRVWDERPDVLKGAK